MTLHHAVSSAGPHAAGPYSAGPYHALSGHTMPTAADTALRSALEAQVAALAPIASSLHSALAHPTVAPADWRGPASAAYDSLETRLRSRLADADGAVAATLQSSRLALGELGG